MDVQRTLTVKTDEEWMRTRTQKATLMLEEMDFIKTMGNAFKEACMPAELTYTVVIGDCSKLELEEIDESGSGLTDSTMPGYLAAKPANRESWQAFGTLRPTAYSHESPKAANILTALVASDTFVTLVAFGCFIRNCRRINRATIQIGRGCTVVSTRNTWRPDTVWIDCSELFIGVESIRVSRV